MNYTIINKSNTFAVLIMISFLTFSSLCFCQTISDVREVKAENTIQKYVMFNGSTDVKQINETGNLHPDNFSAFSKDTIPNDTGMTKQADTIRNTKDEKKDEKIVKSNDTAKTEEGKIKSYDSTRFNMFGDLLRDDTLYNKKYPIWRPIAGVLEQHAFVGLYNRFIANVDFGRVGFNSWSHNIKTGWEWDRDRFGMNFLMHPFSGGNHFMTARSNGYNYWESLPFAFGGSLMWEYFGENTLPSYNDQINTTISGGFYGEILYRLSSNLLDDRTTGYNRFFRELGAAIISPTRFFSRFLQGKLTRVTKEEVYQKEPLNIEISAGMRKANVGNSFGTGPNNTLVNIQLDYGYPFEKREWKPFDFFTIHAGVNLGVGRKIAENVVGYGVLFGKTVQSGKLEMLIGAFQHYDYYDNLTFELGTIGLGGGIMSKYPISKGTYIFTNVHLDLVPLAGNSTRLGPDTSQVRDYTYGGGLETKLETGINFGWASFQVNGNFYWIHTYVGPVGNNYIGIFRPRVTVKLIGNLYAGFEQLVYYSTRNTSDFGNFRSVRTEQRLYLMVNVGNFKL